MGIGPNIHPIAPVTPKRFSLSVAVANTNRDGTGTINTLVTAGLNGTVVPRIRARSALAVTTVPTLQVLRLWHRIANAGSWFLIDEVALGAVAATSAIVGQLIDFNLTNILLGGGATAATTDLLGVTQHVAEAVHYSGEQGDY